MPCVSLYRSLCCKRYLPLRLASYSVTFMIGLKTYGVLPFSTIIDVAIALVGGKISEVFRKSLLLSNRVRLPVPLGGRSICKQVPGEIPLYIVRPPATSRHTPVTSAASSDAKYRAAKAISSAVANRPRGIVSANC